MAIQSAICNNCGGKINVDDVDLNGFSTCIHCKTPFKIIDVITIDGLPTAKSLLITAQFAIEDNNLEKAVQLFKEVIAIKPNCHEAWWGLYLCHDAYDRYYDYKDKYGNDGIEVKKRMMSETLNKYAFRAIDYAPEKESKVYLAQIQHNVDYITNTGVIENNSQKSGCYIATAVYGSSTCHEVTILRNYRDEYLSKRFLGRLFIKIYYSISPFIARYLNTSSKVSIYIRRILDNKINKLKKTSFSSGR